MIKLSRWQIIPLGLAALVVAVLSVVYVADAAGNGNSQDAHSQHAADPLVRTEKSVQFRDDMRKLWEDHITWTRLFIVSFAADLPDANDTAGRLLRNQDDIGDAIKPYYGDAAGDQLSALLHDHITIAVELLTAAKSGETAAFNDANARWYANADDIAAFLHNANPHNWPLADAQVMMHTHLDLTLQEAAARLHGDFPADIAAYDQVHAEILQMADMLSLGIIHQFPGKFR